MQLRPYQQTLVNEVYTVWGESRARVLLQLPTGGGKTSIFSAIASDAIAQGLRVLVIAHRTELISQGAQRLEAIAGCPIGIIQSGYPALPLAPIQVGSVQTLTRRLDRLGHFDMVVIDEAHHAVANSYRRVLQAIAPNYTLGVTATPQRLDGGGFDELFDVLICGPSIKELTALGYLAPYRYFAGEAMTTHGAKSTGGDWSVDELARLNNVHTLSGNLVVSYLAHADGKSCVVFAINVEHSQEIAARYRAAGIPAVHLDGSTPAGDRALALQQFRDGEIKVMSNCALFDEGLDIPAIEVVQLARPTQSLPRYLQSVGRALRPAAGKSHAIILDHTDNYLIHGLPDQHRLWRLDGEVVQQRSKSGGRSLSVSSEGEVLEIIEPPTVLVPVEVQDEVDQGGLDEWMDTLRSLIKTQNDRGYKDGWSYYQLMELNPPLEIWQAYGAYRRWKPGAAWHTFKKAQERAMGIAV